jgi:hypothetical protein
MRVINPIGVIFAPGRERRDNEIADILRDLTMGLTGLWYRVGIASAFPASHPRSREKKNAPHPSQPSILQTPTIPASAIYLSAISGAETETHLPRRGAVVSPEPPGFLARPGYRRQLGPV